MTHSPTIPPTGDVFLDIARRSIMNAVRLGGGSCTQAGLVSGGALHPDGGTFAPYTIGQAARSLAEDGLLHRRISGREIVWSL